MIEWNGQVGSVVRRRMMDEHLVWLTTVGPDGTPRPSLVWFVPDGHDLVIYSQPDTPKLANIARSPKVALNFDSDGDDGGVAILFGSAAVDSRVPPADENPSYLLRYRDRIEKGLGMTPAEFGADYRVPIRVTPVAIRGW